MKWRSIEDELPGVGKPFLAYLDKRQAIYLGVITRYNNKRTVDLVSELDMTSTDDDFVSSVLDHTTLKQITYWAYISIPKKLKNQELRNPVEIHTS